MKMGASLSLLNLLTLWKQPPEYVHDLNWSELHKPTEVILVVLQME